MLQTVVWIQFLAQEFPHAADVIKKKITSLNWLYILLSRPWGNAVYKANVLPLVYIKKEELLIVKSHYCKDSGNWIQCTL